jgi:hypothetical protein
MRANDAANDPEIKVMITKLLLNETESTCSVLGIDFAVCYLSLN